jgi:hypothetical protein
MLRSIPIAVFVFSPRRESRRSQLTNSGTCRIFILLEPRILGLRRTTRQISESPTTRADEFVHNGRGVPLPFDSVYPVLHD